MASLFSRTRSSNATNNITTTKINNQTIAGGNKDTSFIAPTESLNNNAGVITLSDHKAVSNAFKFAEGNQKLSTELVGNALSSVTSLVSDVARRSTDSAKSIISQTTGAIRGIAENVKGGGINWSQIIIALTVIIVAVLAVVLFKK